MERAVAFCAHNPVLVVVGLGLLLFFGWRAIPIEWESLEDWRDPVAVDAIPDIGENQQIVFTEWPGRSPQDVEDQITYPLTATLMSVPKVKTVRSVSMFGFSSIYVIFHEGVDNYWARSRILERLASLPQDALPADARPTLGPDATGLGQVFWYTLEGRDAQGRPTGGWDLEELRSIQDWTVRYALLSVSGVSEVASVGGFVKEYQIDCDPDAMRAYGVSIQEVFEAARRANLDIGAKTMEINRAEYFLRGLGFFESVEDIEQSVVRVREGTPIYIGNVAEVTLGPGPRRGALDKEGAEVVGGVVTIRPGANPMATIREVKRRIESLAASLPKKTLADGTGSQVSIVPFYDRSSLIGETVGSLRHALSLEILVTALVTLGLMGRLRGAALVAATPPLATLVTFLVMSWSGMTANIVALSGIAIAIGTMVDTGIVMMERVAVRLREAPEGADRRQVVVGACQEVIGAISTAVATTVVGFLPVLFLQEAEGRLFQPLAWTKTFALMASIFVAVTLLPPLACWLFGDGFRWLDSSQDRARGRGRPWSSWLRRTPHAALVLWLVYQLSVQWSPLGVTRGPWANALFVAVLLGGVLGLAFGLLKGYPTLLMWVLRRRLLFLCLPLGMAVWGLMVWFGFDKLTRLAPAAWRGTAPALAMADVFPGLGKEFMPPLDEGAFLYMPTTMPHASIGEAMDALRKQDMAIASIPEVESVVGKIGRAETALDPAPISMMETIIEYAPEYEVDANGRRLKFRYDAKAVDWARDWTGEPFLASDGQPYKTSGAYPRDEDGRPIPDPSGRPFRHWRPALDPLVNPDRDPWEGIQRTEDIWDQIVAAGQIPGSTSAPKLQPIAARLVMLQTGMRAPFGLRIQGPDLETIERFGLQLESALREVHSIQPESVFADRIIGKPYLEIEIDRQAIARYGMRLQDVQEALEMAVGGRRATTTVEGRERYAVRVRYLRERRDTLERLDDILIAGANGAQIPLGQLATIQYTRGPQSIRSEDGFLVGYVLFDKRADADEVAVVQEATEMLQQRIASGVLEVPEGARWSFVGSYQSQIRSEKRLMIVGPVALALIFLLLYMRFRSASVSALVFSGVFIAWAGGFIGLWLMGQEALLEWRVFGFSIGEFLQARPYNLSVAVWVGFLALFGIATDDGVLMLTYLEDRFRENPPVGCAAIREATVEAASRRIRACLMTTVTTAFALLPVLTSTGRGSDIMIPMAIPTFGGMIAVFLTVFLAPCLYSAMRECALRTGWSSRVVGALSMATLFIAPVAIASFYAARDSSRQHALVSE